MRKNTAVFTVQVRGVYPAVDKAPEPIGIHTWCSHGPDNGKGQLEANIYCPLRTERTNCISHPGHCGWQWESRSGQSGSRIDPSQVPRQDVRAHKEGRAA